VKKCDIEKHPLRSIHGIKGKIKEMKTPKELTNHLLSGITQCLRCMRSWFTLHVATAPFLAKAFDKDDVTDNSSPCDPVPASKRRKLNSWWPQSSSPSDPTTTNPEYVPGGNEANSKKRKHGDNFKPERSLHDIIPSISTQDEEISRKRRRKLNSNELELMGEVDHKRQSITENGKPLMLITAMNNENETL